jgi:hypothetical protein
MILNCDALTDKLRFLCLPGLPAGFHVPFALRG